METTETPQQLSKERYPIGVQTFADIIKGGYTYVDKTGYIHSLIGDGGKYYFLARPRRFGKSLFLSTLEAFFEGRRELFKGLEIDRLERDWTPSPVLHFDLNSKAYRREEDLTLILHATLRDYEELYGLTPDVPDVDLRFGSLLKRVCEKTGRRVVVLIDEYDKPLVNNFENVALSDAYRAILKGFYGNLKSADRYIRFAMLTGVTRFSKVSIFSDLNNLRDISMSRQYACICGITEEEMLDTFPQGIRRLALETGMTREQTVDELRRHYDGYHFCEDTEGLYNPFSLLNTFADGRFGEWWYTSATTTALARQVRQDRWDLPDLDRATATRAALADIDTIGDPVPLLFQTGYLTIRSYDPRYREYTLGYPNEEVRQGFISSLSRVYINEGLRPDFKASRFQRDIDNGDVDGFMERMAALFANFPYEDTAPRGNTGTGTGAGAGGGEYWFRSIVYTLFMMVGQLARVETHSACGRSDMEVFTRTHIYIFEFKYGSAATPAEAIAQIREKGYARPYAADPREKVLIGAVYRTDMRRLDWLAQSLDDSNV